MAGTEESLKETASRIALLAGKVLGGLNEAAAPPFIRALRSTHQGRRFEEGFSEGVDAIIGYTLGLPQRALRFAHDQTTGARDPTPLKQQIASQEWFVEQLKRAREFENHLTDKPQDSPRQGDNKWRSAGQLTAFAASLFVPGIQEISAVKIPRLVSSVGAQIGSSEIAMDLVDFGENKLDIWAGRKTDTCIAKMGISAEFESSTTGTAARPSVAMSTPAETPALQHKRYDGPERKM